ncbi:unnamed protein product [Ilex paraguariensis]|uniref:Uncharacterized protein n=1 Tax=Ilex paraguariensis TaxID=185542 RepID=A0ABC8V430_9AQUA
MTTSWKRWLDYESHSYRQRHYEQQPLIAQIAHKRRRPHQGGPRGETPISQFENPQRQADRGRKPVGLREG